MLALTVILLALLAGLAFHLLAEGRIRLESSQRAWDQERLSISASTAAKRALQIFADQTGVSREQIQDMEHPHILWSQTQRDPSGIRTDTRIMDAQARFGLNNLCSDIPGGPSPPEAIRIATELFRLHGDPQPAARVSALAQRMELASNSNHPRATAPLLGWDEVAALPEFGMAYLRRPAGQAADGTHRAIPVPLFAALLPHPVDERPLPINIHSANRETLRALLGRDQDQAVERILTHRRQALFRSVAEAGAHTGLGEDRLAALSPWVTLRSEWMEIESVAQWDQLRVVVRVLARQDPAGRVEVIRWIRFAQRSSDA